MATSQWKLTRIEVAEKSITLQEVAAKTQIPLLDRLPQSQCRLGRSYARTQRELEPLQKSRLPIPPKGKASEQPPARKPNILIPGDPDPSADSGDLQEADPQDG